MQFIPYKNKILIKPIEKKDIIPDADEVKFYEKGEVLAVGEEVTWLKIGDTVFFVSHGCWSTPEDEDGIKHFVVTDHPSFILGKYNGG